MEKNERVKNLGEHLSKAIREKKFVIDEELDPINLSFPWGRPIRRLPTQKMT